MLLKIKFLANTAAIFFCGNLTICLFCVCVFYVAARVYWVVSRWLLTCAILIYKPQGHTVLKQPYIYIWNDETFEAFLAKPMRLLNPYCSSLSFLIIFPDLAFRLHSKKWPCYQSKNQSIANAIHKQIKGKDFIASNLAFILGSARTAKRCQAKPIQLALGLQETFFLYTRPKLPMRSVPT